MHVESIPTIIKANLFAKRELEHFLKSSFLVWTTAVKLVSAEIGSFLESHFFVEWGSNQCPLCLGENEIWISRKMTQIWWYEDSVLCSCYVINCKQFFGSPV